VNRALALLTDELGSPDPRQGYARLKQTVADVLSGIDPRIQVVRTEYFNHSRVPDMLVRWPAWPSDYDRYLYLRTTENLSELAEDMEALQPGDRAIVLCLGVLPDTARESSSLQERAHQRGILLMDVPSVMTLTQHEPEAESDRQMNAQLLGFGSGVLDRSAAEAFRRQVERLRLPSNNRFSLDALAEAAQVVVERLGSIVRLANYPDTPMDAWRRPDPLRALTDPPSEEITLLLERAATDPAVLDENAGRIRLERLLAERIPPAAMLQALVRANIDGWTSRACAVSLGYDRTVPERWRWSVADGSLNLRGSEFALHISSTAGSLRFRSELEMPSLEEVQGRARSANVRLARVSLVRGAQSLEYGGKGDVLVPNVLAQLAGNLGPGAQVSRVDVLTSSGAVIRCAYATGRATVTSPRTGTSVPELAFAAACLLADVPESDVSALAEELGLIRGLDQDRQDASDDMTGGSR
jgi:hypothetical protein